VCYIPSVKYVDGNNGKSLFGLCLVISRTLVNDVLSAIGYVIGTFLPRFPRMKNVNLEPNIELAHC